MEVPPPHPSLPTPAAGSGSTALLAAWTTVQQAVRMASNGRLLDDARRLLQRALVELCPVGRDDADGAGADDTVHLDALRQLDQLLAAVESARSASRAGGATGSGTDLELCTRPVRRGDVVCLLRVRGGGPAAYDDVVSRVEVVLRPGDQLVPVGEDHLLVVVASVSLAIAWRRMSGLVGGRPSAEGGRTAVVHAGLAPVDDAGPAAALEAARRALHQAAEDAVGRIALAHVA